jgi:hypothetical protein
MVYTILVPQGVYMSGFIEGKEKLQQLILILTKKMSNVRWGGGASEDGKRDGVVR